MNLGVSVIGAGAWGTALAKHLAEKGQHVTLWCHEDEVVTSIKESRTNKFFLPGVVLPKSIDPTGELSLVDGDIVVFAVPSVHFRGVAEKLAPHMTSEQHFVSATKGIEDRSLLRMSEVLSDSFVFKPDVAVLSGPTFAKEVAQGEPTALVVAGNCESSLLLIQERFSTPSFRIYTNSDLIGVELGGALKNVIALAVGVATGLGLGSNPKAALMSRGLAEVSLLCEKMGGFRETLLGLSGVGDLVLTCTSKLSRNFTVGMSLGKGERLSKILSMMPQVAEGIGTTHAAVALANKYRIDMPISAQMKRLLDGEITAQKALEELFTYPVGPER